MGPVVSGAMKERWGAGRIFFRLAVYRRLRRQIVSLVNCYLPWLYEIYISSLILQL